MKQIAVIIIFLASLTSWGQDWSHCQAGNLTGNDAAQWCIYMHAYHPSMWFPAQSGGSNPQGMVAEVNVTYPDALGKTLVVCGITAAATNCKLAEGRTLDDVVVSLLLWQDRYNAQKAANAPLAVNTNVSTGTLAPISPPKDSFLNLAGSEPSCPETPAYFTGGRCHVILRFADIAGPINVVCRTRQKSDNGWVVVDCSWKPARPTGVSCPPASPCTVSSPKKEKAKP